MRARDLGIAIGESDPGARNAISDVEGVLVGHSTLIEGDDVRTGVTVIVPHETPTLYAGCHRLNGNGELTGLEWVRESGLLTTPIGSRTRTAWASCATRSRGRGRAARTDAWRCPSSGRRSTGSSTTSTAQHVTAQTRGGFAAQLR